MPPTIGYLIPEFPTQTHVFFWRELMSLRKMGLEVQVLSTRRPTKGECPHDFREEALRRTTYMFPPNWFAALATLVTRPARMLRALRLIGGLEGRGKGTPGHLAILFSAAKLLRVSRKQNIGHVHVHSCGNAALLALLCKTLGGPTYSLTLHNPLKTFGSNQHHKWREAEFAIVITKRLYDEVRTELGKELPVRVEIASMGVDLEVFQRAKPYRPWNGGGVCRVFSCGRLNPAKGHDDLIRTVGILRDRGILAKLVIAGEGDSGTGAYRKKLVELVCALGLADWVELIGAVSDVRVREELEQAHVFALASHDEPLGVAIMEAMAMGAPVVVTSAGGVPELVQDGVNGLLVPPRDPVALADGIFSILASPERASAFGEAGRRVVEAKFSSDQSARILKSCFDTLQAHPATGPTQAVPCSSPD
jgi:glycosyltransferase involved in cell wall biosynthesis